MTAGRQTQQENQRGSLLVLSWCSAIHLVILCALQYLGKYLNLQTLPFSEMYNVPMAQNVKYNWCILRLTSACQCQCATCHLPWIVKWFYIWYFKRFPQRLERSKIKVTLFKIHKHNIDHKRLLNSFMLQYFIVWNVTFDALKRGKCSFFYSRRVSPRIFTRRVACLPSVLSFIIYIVVFYQYFYNTLFVVPVFALVVLLCVRLSVINNALLTFIII